MPFTAGIADGIKRLSKFGKKHPPDKKNPEQSGLFLIIESFPPAAPRITSGTGLVLTTKNITSANDREYAILQAGHTLEYLPPYAPDLNPIEPKWAQSKVIRKKSRLYTKTLLKTPNLNQFI
jgi:transposase